MSQNDIRTGDDPGADGHRSRSALGLLALGHVVNDLFQGAVPAIIPFLAAGYHYSYLAISGITLAATFISAIAQPLFGVLADRYRLRWMVGGGIVVAGAGIAASGLLSAYPLIWIVIAVSGVGVAAFHPEASRLARRAAGTSAQGMSWFALGGNIGFAVSSVVITPILLAAGLPGTVYLAVPAVLMAGAIHTLLPRLLAGDRPGSATRRADRRPATDDWRSFRWLTAVIICRSISFMGMGSFLALYLIRDFHVGTALGAAAFTVFTGVGAVATIAGGWLADRIGRVPAIRLGYAVAVVGFAGLVLGPDPAVAFGALVLAGLGLYVPFSVQTTLGQEYLPNRIGTASGVTLGLAVSAGGVASPALGALADSFGVVAAIVVAGAMPLVALAASTRLLETRRTGRPAPTR